MRFLVLIRVVRFVDFNRIMRPIESSKRECVLGRAANSIIAIIDEIIAFELLGTLPSLFTPRLNLPIQFADSDSNGNNVASKLALKPAYQSYDAQWA